MSKISESGVAVDPRRAMPIKIEWGGMIGRLTIDGEHWGAVEWSEKRKAWCIDGASNASRSSYEPERCSAF